MVERYHYFHRSTENRVVCVGLKVFFRGQSDCWISWFEFAFLDILEYVQGSCLLLVHFVLFSVPCFILFFLFFLLI